MRSDRRKRREFESRYLGYVDRFERVFCFLLLALEESDEKNKSKDGAQD